jgi:hypothetical protein
MKAFGIFLSLLCTITAFAQNDQLAGRWEGEINSMQGKRPTTVIFKKEGAEYTGRTTGLRPNTEVKLYDIKVDGAKVTAKTDIESPQATVTINYAFTLAGEALTGEGVLDFGGNAIKIQVNLKRVSADTEGSLLSAAQQQQTPQTQSQGRQQRAVVEQPQQKQSIDYFVGTWGYKYVGRESNLAPAPREGTIVFTKNADGKSVTGVGTGKHDAGAYKDTMTIAFDEATKMLTVTETTAGGVKLNSKGDWSSPISIRFNYDLVTAKGQKLQLRRTLAVVAAHAFTITDELAEDGGPFVRLGNAVYSKVGAN